MMNCSLVSRDRDVLTNQGDETKGAILWYIERQGNKMKKIVSVLCMLCIMIPLVSATCCAVNNNETEPVLSLNGDGLLFIVPTMSEKEELSSASADIYTVGEASAKNLLDYSAIALPIDYVDSFNLPALYSNNVLIYLYGNQVSVDVYTNSVGTDSFGTMQEDITGTPSKVLVAQEQVFQIIGSVLGSDRLAAFIDPDHNGEISSTHFYNIILSDYISFLTVPYTIADSDLNVSVSESGRLETLNCGWILERNMDESDPDADYFGIKAKINPTVLGGGQVARFTEVYTEIQLGDTSKQHIYLSSPTSTTYNRSYSVTIGGGENMSWGLSISGTFDGTVTINRSANHSSGNVMWTFTSSSLNEGEYETGLTFSREVTSGSQTVTADVTFGGKTTGWSSGTTFGPKTVSIVYPY